MKAESKSVAFLKEIQTFEIPFFQRAYVWKKDNWEELLDDLMQVNRRHFLGSVIIKKIEESGSLGLGFTRVSVIDGQQRLTTLSILLKAIYDSFCKEIKDNVSDSIKNALFYKKNITDSAYFTKVKHSKVDRVDFEKVIGGISVDGISSIEYSDVDGLDVEDDNSNHKILCCYKYFYDRLKGFSQENLALLFRSILSDDNKMLVVIVLDKEDHEQQIFDTINSAGVRLTSTDIVKNALFQKIMEFDKDEQSVYDFYDLTWNDAFGKDDDALTYWGKKKTVGRVQRDNSEMLLQSVAIIENIFDPSEHTLNDIPDLYKAYIESMDEKGVKTFVKKIVEYAGIYRENVPEMSKTTHYSYYEYSKRLFHILEILGLTTFTPYILFLLKKYVKDEQTLQCRLYDLEKFVMRRMIFHQSTAGYNKNCLEFIQDERKAGEMAALITNDEILEGLTKVNNREATLLLFWVELRRRSESAKYDLKELVYEYTLEHIMPQKWEEHWQNVPYVGFDGKELQNVAEGKRKRYQLVYSIGNMTLLNSKLNGSIQNNDFITKIKGTSKKRKGIESYASLSITKDDIIHNIYEANKNWNERTIFLRQVELTKEILAMWSIGENSFIIPETLDFSTKTTKDPFKKSLEKRPASGLRIIKEDGSKIEFSQATETFIEVIKQLSKEYSIKKIADAVKNENIQRDKDYIIRKGVHTGKNVSSYPVKQGYFVNVHSSTEAKKKQLEKIFVALGCTWNVELVN